ncbi:MAG: F0F1 ATP synthase subunit delta [Nocardioidaceae bacterium]
MQAGSAHSLDAVLECVDQALETGVDPTSLGDELFAVVLILDSRHSLRRALTEPAVPADAKSTLWHTLVEGKISEGTIGVVDAAVRRRWSQGRDLADALERASVTAHVVHADRNGHLDDLEDNLFRFGRILEAQPELRDVLSDLEAPAEGKREILHSLLQGKVAKSTEHLLGQAVAGRHRSLFSTMSTYQRIAADRRDRLVATVWVATPLSENHKQRLARALAAQYSHEVHINVIVDPQVLGGVRVAVGNDVIDSTVETRLAKAHRGIAP